ncbi:MAG: TraB/GumN family protein [Defluviitaleaceae bacterium]|nr:TraB/GumN family protein [Defluviitaleaceae bacterium]
MAYLFGALHVGQAHWFPLSDLVEDAIRRANVVVMEIAEPAGDPEVMAEIRSEIRYLPDGQTLEEFLPEAYYRHLADMVAVWEACYDTVNTWRPSYLIGFLEFWLDDVLSVTDVGLETSVDGHIISVAKETGLPIIGLESMAQQLNILFNLPEDAVLAQIRNLEPPLVTLETRANLGLLSLDEMAYAYERNDFTSLHNNTALSASIDHYCPSTRYFFDTVVRARTIYYANEIERLLRETEEPTTFFVSVGLGHIINSGAGEQFTDIVELLRLNGFYVEPLWR